MLAACTIASNNYLAMARVFAESYLARHPGARIFVCVADEPSPAIRYSQFPFTSVFARDLGIPSFRNMAFRYEVTELNTAVKPYFLAHLRDHYGLDKVLYFDPDVFVYDRLEALEDELRTAPMLVTPHITQPLEGNRTPSDRLFLQVGVYNLGFLGLRLDASTASFLDWWSRRLERYCLHDLASGLFVDQGWMDLAPAFVDGVRVLRDPIYNVAYWNLDHRSLRLQGGRWTIDGRPLGFFHFSGLEVDDLETVSKYQNRLRLSEREELRPLFEDYRARLTDRGFLASRGLPYAYGTFRGLPLPIPKSLRRALNRVDPEGRRWPDPFATDLPDSYFKWLERTHEYAQGALPVAALCLWEERWDLRLAFPDVTDTDLPAFVRWLRRGGGSEAGLWPSVVQRATVHRHSRPKRVARVAPRTGPGIGQTPLDLRRPGRSVAWLNQPAPGLRNDTPCLTVASLLLHQMRPDVQSAYPDPYGDDQAAFAYWFVFFGANEAGLDPQLIAPIARTLPLAQRLKYGLASRRRRNSAVEDANETVPASPASPPSPAPASPLRRGVNLAGYFEMDTGVGQVARGSLTALEAAGVPCAPISLDHTVMAGERPDDPRGGAPYGVSLVHANADQSAVAIAELPAGAAASSFKVGYWFWELAHFPIGFSDRFTYFDEIWAPSRFCADSIASLASVPVRHVPPCVLPPVARPVDRAALGLDRDRFYFFFSFDIASVPDRKNPFAAIEAIARLVRSKSPRVGLVLKIVRAERSPVLTEKLRASCKGLPIVLLTERAGRAELETWLSASDACLSLHRSEGLGLLPIEAMYLGKPVVATGYGGVTDYLDETTGFPVRYELSRLEHAHGPYPEGAAWAEPSIDDAVASMRMVMELPEIAGERARRAGERVRELYSVPSAAARFIGELDRILGPIPEPAASTPSAEALPDAAGSLQPRG